jgi:LmbE family N-acetylglucosaminyl deacetylase
MSRNADTGDHPGGPVNRAPVLMVVHAHPDDESSQTGGTLAAYATAGWHTVLISCTDGRGGDGSGGARPGDAGHDPHQVATRRHRELDLAAAALGVGEVVRLGYPDSGPTAGGHVPTDAFSVRPLMPMVTRLVRLIRLHQPAAIVTYPPNGLSGHPDHIRAHQLVTAALRNINANRAATAGGAGPLLYYIAVSRGRLASMRASARTVPGAETWSPPDDIAIDDERITTVIDITAHWPAKLRALSAHASQADAAALLAVFSAAGIHRVEEFMRADHIPDTLNSPLEAGFGGPAPGEIASSAVRSG